MGVRLLDGGVGHDIFAKVGRRGANYEAIVNIDHFGIVREVHESYLRVGAEVITANTYAAGRHKMNKGGHANKFAAANYAAIEAAEAAREAVNPAALIAGALGPLRGAYQPDWAPPRAQMEAEFAEQALLLAPRVDLFLVETMSLIDEAVAGAAAASAAGRPVWVAFTIDELGEPRLRSGEPLGAAVKALEGFNVTGVLVNCTAPEAVSRAIPVLRANADDDVAVGGYANNFERIPDAFGFETFVDDIERRADVDPKLYAIAASDWIADGATIVGGCCGVGPAHIAQLAELIRKEGR